MASSSIETAPQENSTLQNRYDVVRGFTLQLCEPLQPEDCVVQSMPDVSPTRWHLAHTTWFFETFVLADALPGYEPYSAEFAYLFNSYYNSIGEQFPRSMRGLLTRPTVAEVLKYRAYVDRHMQKLLRDYPEKVTAVARVIETGLHHEQQHQELILTDIKHVLAQNPLWPVYRHTELPRSESDDSFNWIGYAPELAEIGYGGEEFCFDNELPRHKVYLAPFEIADRLVTCGEYGEFIEAGGYQQAAHWLSEGWGAVQAEQWQGPLYWTKVSGQWHEFTLSGLMPLDRDRPVVHVSYFEADAYARWRGCRLPTEAEWEVVAGSSHLEGNFAEQGLFHPVAAKQHAAEATPRQLGGDVWEWTSSSYAPYPGYRAPVGAIGEYNGKFMCNQYVLRGGSCATSQSHMRPTYRNFFPAGTRWQFSGIRLAR